MAVCVVVLWNVQRFWRDDATLLGECLNRFPESAFCRSAAADIIMFRGDLAGAEKELQKAHALEPGYGPVLVSLAATHARMGRTQEAATEVANALKLMPNAPVDTYALLAKLHAANGDDAGSEQILKRAESLPGGFETVSLVRAQMKLAHGDASDAESILRKLAEHHGGDSTVWTTLGMALTSEGRNEDAAAAYRRALALTPWDVSARLLLALALHASGRDAEALNEVAAGLAQSPGNANLVSAKQWIEEGRKIEMRFPANSFVTWSK